MDSPATDDTFLAYIADGAYVGTTTERSGYSTDGGVTFNAWETLPSGYGSGGAFTGAWAGGIAAASTSNVIWAGANGHQPYYTNNANNANPTWNAISLPGVSSWSGFQGNWYGNNRAVCADRVSPNTFYLLFLGVGVFSTTNGGADWKKVFTANSSFFGAPTEGSQIQAMPGQHGYLYFSADNPNYNPCFSTNGGVKWDRLPNVANAFCLGFGAAGPGSRYATIYIVGVVNNAYGIWLSTSAGLTWTYVGSTPYPNASLDVPRCISGDPSVYGRVYVGFGGSGYVCYHS